MATTVTGTLEPPPGRSRRRRPWESPDDQPGYARPALLAITAVAATLFSWGIDRHHYHIFYANAVRSMSHSWRAFLFGSFDPNNSITLDKLPGFLWPQALSARVFGFHSWALDLPQVIEGVLSVLVLYRIVRRWAGTVPALTVAAAFTLTPATVGVFRSPAEDGAFTLLLLLAADACLRAALTGRLRALLLSGVWVGLAFQAKMLEAWVVLPALAITYLLAAPVTLRRRIGHVLLAGAVTAVVSASWLLVATATPARDRPYVDGTTDNSPLSMVVGYNFLNRFGSIGLDADGTGSVTRRHGGFGGPPSGTPKPDAPAPGAGAGAPAAPGTAAGAAGSAVSDPDARAAEELRRLLHRGRNDGWGKMFGTAIASQTGWAYPLAGLALVIGLAWRRGHPRTDGARAGLVLWGTWLATFLFVFSAGSVGGHMYYMGVVAVPVAALGGAGLLAFWRGYRDGGPRAWALPVAVAGTAAWCAFVTSRYPSFLPWLGWTVAGLGAAAVALLGVARTRPGRWSLVGAGLPIAISAVFLAPGAWAASVLAHPEGAVGIGGAIGPASPRRELILAALRRLSPGGGTRGGRFGESAGRLTPGQDRLLTYLKEHRGKTRYLFAASNWRVAAPYILARDAPVLPMGGFTGQAPFPGLARFRGLVAQGQVRYVLVGPVRPFHFADQAATPTTAVMSWVRSACAPVPAAAYGGTGGGTAGASAAGESLYRCG